MNRRIFVKNVLIASGGILLCKSLIGCTSEKVQINELIGKSENVLDKYKKNGDTNFGYYNLSNSEYSHPDFESNNIFIYCQDKTIVGYTIQIKEIKNFENYKSLLSKNYGPDKKTYKNDFGKAFQWKKNNRKLTIEITKDDLNIPSNIFFSESILDNNLIVFE